MVLKCPSARPVPDPTAQQKGMCALLVSFQQKPNKLEGLQHHEEHSGEERLLGWSSQDGVFVAVQRPGVSQTIYGAFSTSSLRYWIFIRPGMSHTPISLSSNDG